MCGHCPSSRTGPSFPLLLFLFMLPHWNRLVPARAALQPKILYSPSNHAGTMPKEQGISKGGNNCRPENSNRIDRGRPPFRRPALLLPQMVCLQFENLPAVTQRFISFSPASPRRRTAPPKIVPRKPKPSQPLNRLITSKSSKVKALSLTCAVSEPSSSAPNGVLSSTTPVRITSQRPSDGLSE